MTSHLCDLIFIMVIKIWQVSVVRITPETKKKTIIYHINIGNLRIYQWVNHNETQNGTYSSSRLSSSLNLRRASSFSREFSFILPIMLSSLFLWAEWISWTMPCINHRKYMFVNHYRSRLIKWDSDLDIWPLITLYQNSSQTTDNLNYWYTQLSSTQLCNG